MEKEHKEIVEIDMYRRITGYVVPNVKRWNSGKKAELKDRTTHAGDTCTMGGRGSGRSLLGILKELKELKED